jgi:hypothetical protein
MEAGKMQHRFADGFAGDGSRIDGRAADDFEFFDKSGALAKLHGLNGRALSRGTGAEDDEVVTLHSDCAQIREAMRRKYTTAHLFVFGWVFY